MNQLRSKNARNSLASHRDALQNPIKVVGRLCQTPFGSESTGAALSNVATVGRISPGVERKFAIARTRSPARETRALAGSVNPGKQRHWFAEMMLVWQTAPLQIGQFAFFAKIELVENLAS